MNNTKEKKKGNCRSNANLPVPVPNLPEEIIVGEILSRLPVQSLVRFRSVCKSWNSIIASNPQFAALQFKHSVKNKFDRRRVLIWDHYSAFLIEKKASTNSFTNEKLNCCQLKGFTTNNCPIVATCDGMLCIKIKTDVILLLNSLTGETKRVVEPPIKFPFHYCPSPFNTRFTYGLGYDSSTDDYKLVSIYFAHHHGGDEIGSEVRVYSLRTSSWRQIQDFPYGIRLYESGVFVNGALHWAAHVWKTPGHCWKVASFDLAEEKYRLICIPEMGRIPSLLRVSVLDEKLYVSYSPDRVHRDIYSLWLVNEYENAESWTKYTITNPGGLTPLCLLNCEEVLLAAADKLLVCNLNDLTFRHLQIPGIPKFFQAITFLETLFSPKTYNGISN